MKKLSIILIMAAIFAACNAQQINVEAVEPIDSTSTIIEERVDTILFSYSNLIQMRYVEEAEMAVICYDDPDVFDLDNMAYVTGRDKWYDTCIYMSIEESLFPEFVYNYENYKYTDDFWRKEKLNSSWIIEEHDILYLDRTRDLIYYIVPSKASDGD